MQCAAVEERVGRAPARIPDVVTVVGLCPHAPRNALRAYLTSLCEQVAKKATRRSQGGRSARVRRAHHRQPSGGGRRVRREWTRVEPMLKELGFEGETVFTDGVHALSLAEQACADGHEVVVAVGGDRHRVQAAPGPPPERRGHARRAAARHRQRHRATLAIRATSGRRRRSCSTATRREVRPDPVGEHLVLNAIGVGLPRRHQHSRRPHQAGARHHRYLGVALVSAGQIRVAAGRARDPGPALIRAREDPRRARRPDHRRRLHPRPARGARRRPPRRHPGAGDRTVGRLPRLVAAMRGTLGRIHDTVELQSPWLELRFDRPLPMHVDGDIAVLEPPRRASRSSRRRRGVRAEARRRLVKR